MHIYLLIKIEVMEQNSLNPISILEEFVLNEALRYYGEEQRFSYWRRREIFFDDFHALAAAFKYLIAALNLKWIMSRLSLHKN